MSSAVILLFLSGCNELRINPFDSLGTSGGSGGLVSYATLLDTSKSFATGGAAGFTTGSSHSCAITKDTRVLCWGSNTDGQLGRGTTHINDDPQALPEYVIGGEQGGPYLTNIIQVSAGHSSSCALEDSGRVYCWGVSSAIGGGPAVVDSTFPIGVVEGAQGSGTGRLEDIVYVGTGFSNNCALDSSGHVYCWGAGGQGKLGSGNTSSQDEPIRVIGGDQGGAYLESIRQVYVGYREACAVSEDDELFCWGDNRSVGRIGLAGSITSPLRPHSGEQVGHTYLENVKEVATSWNETCALINDGSVYCWGGSNTNRLGHDQSIVVPVDRHREPMRVLRGEQSIGSDGDYLGSATRIFAGIGGRCVLLEGDDRVLCWGGVLGNHFPTYLRGGDQGGEYFRRVHSFNFTGVHFCFFDLQNYSYCIGPNPKGQLGLGTTSAGYVVPRRHHLFAL